MQLDRHANASAALISAAAVLATLSSFAEGVVDGRAIADAKQGANWLSVGRTYSENRYSPLVAVNTSNVRQLGLAWYLDLPNQGPLQGTPLAVDGILYFTGMMGTVYAAEGRTGRLLWQFDPDLAHHLMDERRVIWNGNRGVAFWNGKVYVGTVDGRLVALDAKTGRVVWTVQTFDESNTLKTISGAPRAFNGKVIIGHGGESGTRGYVTSYDAETGRKLWRFYTVPGDPTKGFENEAMAMAAKTWHGKWWEEGGNATVWDSITYDPDFNRVYIATANGTPTDANLRGSGGGDNLFVASIVALDADTGRYVWHYQVNPGEMWEYDATNQMVLADLSIGGKMRKVVMQAPKNGFFYVIDRTDGRVISAEKLGKVTWAKRVDLKSGRPVESPGIRYKEDKRDAIVIWPSAFGMHNWQAMSFDPATGLMYIPTMKLGMGIGSNTWDLDPREPADGTAALVAWDPVEQKKRWEVPLGDSFWNGGTLATAGNLVFQGTGSGEFDAYNAVTGERLWSFYAGLGINAGAMTYAVDGAQYVAVLVGYGGTINGTRVRDYGWRYGEQPRRLLSFALGMSTVLPPTKPPRFTVNAIDDPSFVIDVKLAGKGREVYGNCAPCHGIEMRNIASFARDLRESSAASSWEGFRSVVKRGTYFPLGMPKFDNLSDDDLRALYMYIRQRARESARAAR